MSAYRTSVDTPTKGYEIIVDNYNGNHFSFANYLLKTSSVHNIYRELTNQNFPAEKKSRKIFQPLAKNLCVFGSESNPLFSSKQTNFVHDPQTMNFFQ